MRRKILIASLLLTAAACGAAVANNEGPAVAASVDRRTIRIGDRIKYALEVATEKKTELEFPKFSNYRIGDFEIKDSGTLTKKGIFGGRTQSNWYYITSYEAGAHTIPETEIRYRQRGEKVWRSKKVRPIEIVVESVLPAGRLADIKDIKGPLHLAGLRWIITAGLITLVSGTAVFIVRRALRRPSPPKLPHETALEELEAIKGQFSRRADIKEYYVGISDCIRRYIERVFKMKAPEMTTEEFLNSLKDSKSLSIRHKDLLKGFLSACDLVKFAKYAPGREEMDAVFVTAKGFIEETKPAMPKQVPASKG